MGNGRCWKRNVPGKQGSSEPRHVHRIPLSSVVLQQRAGQFAVRVNDGLPGIAAARKGHRGAPYTRPGKRGGSVPATCETQTARPDCVNLYR